MKPEHWQKAKELIPLAEQLDAEEQAAFLDREFGDDAELRQAVESLLEVTSSETNDPLLHPPVRLTEKMPAPEQIESYRILHKLGQGGGGAVYLAEHIDDRFQQTVAIKILSNHTDPRFAELFRRERQILADLVHSGISRLFSAGSLEDGRPYFVMEFIEGQLLTEYCDKKKLNVAQRLRLFQKVCAAVQYAHQKLVVHRDLKPQNILVDDQGEPKLLDFGIAQIVDFEHDSGGREFGKGFGTRRYVSPEQANGEPTTTTADIYSLGLILTQLLTNHVPVSPETKTQHLQFEAGLNASDSLDDDQKAILKKALHWDPGQRYPTVDALSEDIRRHLRREPVLARKPTLRYICGPAPLW